MEFLDNIEVSLLDHYVGTPAEAGIDSDESDKATIFTVSVNYNAPNLDELDSISLTAAGRSSLPIRSPQYGVPRTRTASCGASTASELRASMLPRT